MMVRAKDLQEGMKIDVEPVITSLVESGQVDADDVGMYLISAENEYAEVLQLSIDFGYDSVAIFTDNGTWAVPSDMFIDVPSVTYDYYDYSGADERKQLGSSGA